MDTYLYKYECPRWWGTVSGVKNVYFTEPNDDEKKVIDILQKKENESTGSRTCNVKLLQKLKISIESVKNYGGLATIPMSVENDK